MSDPYNLQRFLDAQADMYGRALEEVRGGSKRSHWMWVIFPQIAGLGSSPTARFYALSGLAEAIAYLDHPVLGARLRDITAALQALPDGEAETIFGGIDAAKLRSSLTLFARAAGDAAIFHQALDRWFGGVQDVATIRRL